MGCQEDAKQAPVSPVPALGIFVGEWAPTFFGLGLALSHYEQQDGTLTADVHEFRPTRKAG